MAFFSVKEIIREVEFLDSRNDMKKIIQLDIQEKIPHSVRGGLFKTTALKMLRVIYGTPTTKELAEVLLKEFSTTNSIPDESRDEGLTPLIELQKQKEEKDKTN